MNQSMQSSQTLEQQRAKFAWELVQRVSKGGSDETKKSFGLQAKKMPVRILSSGLGQSLAFLNAHKDAPELLDALNQWIGKRAWALQATDTSKPGATLIERIIENDSEFLRMATQECLALLQWIMRFSDALELSKSGQNSASGK